MSSSTKIDRTMPSTVRSKLRRGRHAVCKVLAGVQTEMIGAPPVVLDAQAGAYVDFNATTPVDPLVLEAMLPYLRADFANPAATHAYGRDAAAAVERGREQLAKAIGASPSSIVFTSGATEADALALVGAWESSRLKGRSRVVTVATEHKAVLECALGLAERGADVVVLPVDSAGQIDLDQLEHALAVPTAVVSVMTANNETGVVMPVAQIASLARDAGALVHTDAAQVLGKISFDVDTLSVDMASLSAHKAYGPKGIGALFVRGGVELRPLLRGGGQERNLRSGTLNVPGIVGFGEAASLARARLADDASEMAGLRDRLWSLVSAVAPTAARNPGSGSVLPNTLNFRIPGVDADDVLMAVPPLGASTGSACAAGSPEPSHVLLAMGLSYEDARGSFRFSVGRSTTLHDLTIAADLLSKGLNAVGAPR